MSSLANETSKSENTGKTSRASPCKSIRNQILERAVAIETEIDNAHTQLKGLIKLAKADTNNPTGKSGDSNTGFLPKLNDLNPFSGGGKKKRGRKTRGRKKTSKRRYKSKRRH